MININNNNTNCVLLLQEFVPTITPASKYAINADSKTAPKVLTHLRKKKIEIKPTDKLDPTNIRIIGHYEDLNEAKFILKKLRKSIDWDKEGNDATVIIDTKSFYKSEHSYTPKYTNSVSNVMHHINDVKLRVNYYENNFEYIDLISEAPSITFRDWVLKNETN